MPAQRRRIRPWRHERPRSPLPVAGRKRATTAAGLIVKHNYKGDRCFGSGAPPFEEASGAIEAAIAHHEKIDAVLAADWRAHREARRNTPFAASKKLMLAFAAGEILRLKRRLIRQRREFGAAAYPPSNQRRWHECVVSGHGARRC